MTRKNDDLPPTVRDDSRINRPDKPPGKLIPLLPYLAGLIGVGVLIWWYTVLY